MFSGNGDSGDTVATISATRIFITVKVMLMGYL